MLSKIILIVVLIVLITLTSLYLKPFQKKQQERKDTPLEMHFIDVKVQTLQEFPYYQMHAGYLRLNEAQNDIDTLHIKYITKQQDIWYIFAPKAIWKDNIIELLDNVKITHFDQDNQLNLTIKSPNLTINTQEHTAYSNTLTIFEGINWYSKGTGFRLNLKEGYFVQIHPTTVYTF